MKDTSPPGAFAIRRPEDPGRIGAFGDALRALDWSAAASVDSLDALRRALDELAEAEIRYYYRRRSTRAWISGLCRFVAWTGGTLGLLLPLLAATGLALTKDALPWGYVFLAVAASALAANSLFGGTAGHVRFVATQLALERLVTTTRIEWARWRASPAPVLDEGFTLLRRYADTLYDTSIAETGRWAETTVAELSKFESSVGELAKGRR